MPSTVVAVTVVTLKQADGAVLLRFQSPNLLIELVGLIMHLQVKNTPDITLKPMESIWICFWM